MLRCLPPTEEWQKARRPIPIPIWHVKPLGVGANHQRDNQGEEKRRNQE